MHISTIRIKNYRRLVDAKIDLDKEMSIFVGANNSGKTSVSHAVQSFINGSRDRIQIHDISACRWRDIEAFQRGDKGASLPETSIDLWFEVQDTDLHWVVDLLPSLDWKGTKVGLRISFAPTNPKQTLDKYRKSIAAQEEQPNCRQIQRKGTEDGADHKSLRKFLEERLKTEYNFRYFVLDPVHFDEEWQPKPNYEPHELLSEQGRSGRDIINSLVKVDSLHAQRHLSDSEGGARVEDLSRHLSRYYKRNLEQHTPDQNAMAALATTEQHFDEHLNMVFADVFAQLETLGYPGLSNPKMLIKSTLDPSTIMNSGNGTRVHYALDGKISLPDKYNGLGFKNLIYMVVELLDLDAKWNSIEKEQPPLHLVFIEEPEVHMHPPLQQVFVKQVCNLIKTKPDVNPYLRTQLALTTHSPHVLYTSEFGAIRYFRRTAVGVEQKSEVLNLTSFWDKVDRESITFLNRYMKLTHCDLFFADAAILVEGNVERLLMPQFIEAEARGLNSSYLSVLEVGGAHAHRFKQLIEFLKITTLIITDLDSVRPRASNATNDNGHGRICNPAEDGAVTSNQILKTWLPGKNLIRDILKADESSKTVEASQNGLGAVRVTYPVEVKLTRESEVGCYAPRTLEVAIAFQNLEWTQTDGNEVLQLQVKNPPTLDCLVKGLHEKVSNKNFHKTDFALSLLQKDPQEWTVPQYIADGLKWLEMKLHPVVKTIDSNGHRIE